MARQHLTPYLTGVQIDRKQSKTLENPLVTRDLQNSAYVKWALKVDIRLLMEGFLLNEQTWLQHLKENAWLMDYLKTV